MPAWLVCMTWDSAMWGTLPCTVRKLSGIGHHVGDTSCIRTCHCSIFCKIFAKICISHLRSCILWSAKLLLCTFCICVVILGAYKTCACMCMSHMDLVPYRVQHPGTFGYTHLKNPPQKSHTSTLTKAFKALSYWVFVLFYLFFPACPKKQ